MAKSQETFSKKEKEKKRLKKRQDKQSKKEERRASSDVDGTLDTMMAYLDENGNIVDTPPDPLKKKKVINADSIELGVPKREDNEVAVERRGRITYFNDSKGYGFIKEDGTQENFFVHVNGLMMEVRENDVVLFEIERGLKGMNAVKVRKA